MTDRLVNGFGFKHNIYIVVSGPTVSSHLHHILTCSQGNVPRLGMIIQAVENAILDVEQVTKEKKNYIGLTALDQRSSAAEVKNEGPKMEI